MIIIITPSIIVLLMAISIGFVLYFYYASTHKTVVTAQSSTPPVSKENKPTTLPTTPAPTNKPTSSPIQSPTTPSMTNNCCRNIDYSDPSKKIKTVVSSWNDCRPCNQVLPGCQFLPNAESCIALAPLCKWNNNKCFNVKNTRTAETIPCDATITNKTCVDYTKLAQYE